VRQVGHDEIGVEVSRLMGADDPERGAASSASRRQATGRIFNNETLSRIGS